MEGLKISHRHFHPQGYAELGQDRKEMCKDLWHTCTAIVLPNKPFVW